MQKRIELGPRDDERFTSVEDEEREYLAFLIDFTMGILEKRPNQIEALNCAATALTALGYYQDGLRMDMRLARIRPTDAGVIYNLACSLSLTGGLAKSLEALEKAIEFGYDDVSHMRSDPDLANVRTLPAFDELTHRVRVGHGR